VTLKNVFALAEGLALEGPEGTHGKQGEGKVSSVGGVERAAGQSQVKQLRHHLLRCMCPAGLRNESAAMPSHTRGSLTMASRHTLMRCDVMVPPCM